MIEVDGPVLKVVLTEIKSACTVDLMGFAPAVNTVTFATPPGGTPVAADFRSGDFFQKALSWSNSAAARFEGVDISTDGQLGPEETRWVFLPKTPEWFSHDLDGNLLTDGKWIYTWDGENRLISMETSTALPAREVEHTRLFMQFRASLAPVCAHLACAHRLTVEVSIRPSCPAPGSTGASHAPPDR